MIDSIQIKKDSICTVLHQHPELVDKIYDYSNFVMVNPDEIYMSPSDRKMDEFWDLIFYIFLFVFFLKMISN